MTAVISEISVFNNFFKFLYSQIKASFESWNGFLESYLVVQSDFWKFQILTTFSTFSNLTGK